MRRLEVAVASLAVVALILAPLLVFAFAAGSTCHAQQRQYDTLHRVIVAAFTAPPDAHLTPAMAHQIAALRHRLEDAEGARPSC